MSTGVDFALELTRISKRYGSTTVLDGVSLHVRPRTVHALLGENGAGKTTLMRIAFGMVQPDAGTVRVAGRQAVFRTPASAISAGIGMVHQHFTLVPTMTVAENLALGGHGPLHLRTEEDRVRMISDLTGFALDPSALVASLPMSAQQRVEIAKALARRATMLVLDEPTAVLAPAETRDLLRWLRTFVAAGNAAVLITHKLHEALAVADDVTVLRRGRVAHVGRAAKSTAGSLTTAMIGAALAPVGLAPMLPTAASAGLVAFRAQQLTLCDDRGKVRVREATFVVRAGEIVGVAGVEGAGQRELLRALAGRHDITSGTLRRPPVVGFVPEDRHRDAVLLDRSLAENIALRGAGRRRGRIRWEAVQSYAESLMRAFDVRPPDSRASMRLLSGGNQQRLVLAREMDHSADAGGARDERSGAIVAENPTRGLDVRAMAEIHARLRAARDAGAAVVIYSSDLDEVLALASRVFVVFAGTLREVGTNRDEVGRAMLGLA